jgi:sigma-E factor negative regulatory protein RseA
MSQNARESLSALMDNEGDELELRRVLKSLDDSPDAADTWRRYHLMRSLMRREPEIDVATDLSAGIMARLEEEPLPQVEASPAPGRSMSLVRGAGIAAAVSLMVITGVQFYHGDNGIGTGQAPADLASQPSSPPPSSADIQASPVALGGTERVASLPDNRPSLADLPLFQTPSSNGRGLMTVGAGVDSPLVLSPRQSARINQQQAQLLQSYLDRHAEGAAYGSVDTWMPLLRASGSESLGQR